MNGRVKRLIRFLSCDHLVHEAEVASSLLKKESNGLIMIPDDLIESYKDLAKKMSDLDPKTEIRIGDWDIGNFGQPAYLLERYNRKRGGIPISAERGLSVQTLINYFNEDDKEAPTGYTLVKLLNDKEVNELWVAAKLQIDMLISRQT